MPQMLSAEFNSYWTQNIPDSWIWLHQNEQWRGDIIFLSVYTSLFGRPGSSDQCLDLPPWQYLYQNQDQNILHLPAQSSKRFSSLQNEKRKKRTGEEEMWLLHTVCERERVERTWALKKKNSGHCKTDKAEILNHNEKYFEKLFSLIPHF